MRNTFPIGPIIILAVCLTNGGCNGAEKKPPHAKSKAVAADITCGRAVQMLEDDPKNTFLVDVRSRPEYQMIGHPQGAYNIPFMFWSGKFNGSKYALTRNDNFQKDLLARFNPKTDTRLIMCRSGNRSLPAVAAAIETGWPTEQVFNLKDGFEGGKVKDKNSVYHGQRRLKGWRVEGFPWTYGLDKNLIYRDDL